MGVAFQILNDLKDWEGDEDNKMLAGQDVLSERPTVLLALALEGSSPADREELLALLQQTPSQRQDNPHFLTRIQHLFHQAQVFEKADKLVEKYRSRAESLADEVEPTELRELLYYLVDSVLDRQQPARPPEPPPLVQLAIVS